MMVCVEEREQNHTKLFVLHFRAKVPTGTLQSFQNKVMCDHDVTPSVLCTINYVHLESLLFWYLCHAWRLSPHAHVIRAFLAVAGCVTIPCGSVASWPLLTPSCLAGCLPPPAPSCLPQSLHQLLTVSPSRVSDFQADRARKPLPSDGNAVCHHLALFLTNASSHGSFHARESLCG